MPSQDPVCLVEYNVYQYDQVPVLLPTGKTEKCLRQTKQISSITILDVAHLVVTENIGSGSDDFSIVLNNKGGKYTDRFIPFQEIAVYLGFPTDPNNIVKEDLAQVIVGLIDDAEPSYDKHAGSQITINGRNYASVLLDNKVTEVFKKMTATKMVETLVLKYGLGFSANIVQTQLRYNKTIRSGSPSGLAAMSGRVNANLELPSQVQGAIQFLNPRSATEGGIDDYVFKNKTAWEAIESLAYMEATVDPEAENRELIAYFDGKSFYFGPRRNVEDDPTKMFQLSVSENVENYRFRMSSQFIHTRIRLVTRQVKNGVMQKAPYIVLVPDDLKAPTDLAQSELDTFVAFQKTYGIRELTMQDRDQQWGGNIKKIKRVGIAKLKEFTRLAFTGEVKFTFLAGFGNAAISLLHKDRAVYISGIPAEGGVLGTQFAEPQSERYNGVFYIEKCIHSFSKNDGYQVSMHVSSRKPEKTKSLSNLTFTPSNLIVNKVDTANDSPYDEPESLLRD